LKALVVRRALGQLVVEAYESGQRSLEEKNYRAAVAYFDLAAAGSANPAWAHYQRARAYAMLADRKKMLAELKLSLAGGFHETSALEAAEFQARGAFAVTGDLARERGAGLGQRRRERRGIRAVDVDARRPRRQQQHGVVGAHVAVNGYGVERAFNGMG
jgi:hypothetical protein